MRNFFRLMGVIFFLGVGCNQTSHPQETNHFSSSQNISEVESPPLEATAENLSEYATTQWRKGNYEVAMDYFSRAYKIAKESKDEEKIAKILNNMGLVHWRLGDNRSAMNCYVEANKIAEKLQLPRLLGLTFTNQALIEKEEEKYDLAIENNQKAIEIFQSNNIEKDLAIAYNNHGQIYKKQFLNDSALANYSKAMKIYERIRFYDGISATYYNLAEVYSRKHQKSQALAAAQKSLQFARESESKVRVSEAYYRLSQTYEHFREADSALKYHQKFTEHEIDILNNNQSEKLIEQQAKWNNEIQELRIQNLENEKTIANNRAWMMVIGLLTLLICSALFWRQKNIKSRMKEKHLATELENSQEILRIKQEELRTYILDLTQKNQLINDLQEGMLNKSENKETRVAQLLNQKILTDEDWEKFKWKFNEIYSDFLPKLKLLQTFVTEAETRLLVLLRLKLSGKEMADTLGISPQSVRVTKMRLKKKLQEENYESVEELLTELVE